MKRVPSRKKYLPDPGKDCIERQIAQASACFQVGDEVLCLDRYSGCPMEARVMSDYRMYRVRSDAGPYIAADGTTGDYRHGYVVCYKHSGREYFAYAYQLTRADGKPAHVRLVHARTEEAGSHDLARKPLVGEIGPISAEIHPQAENFKSRHSFSTHCDAVKHKERNE